MAVKIAPKRPTGAKVAPKRPAAASSVPPVPRACRKRHVPNAVTAKVLRDAKAGRNLLRRYSTAKEMLKDFGL